MAPAVRSSSQEYWRPANPEVARLIEPAPAGAACWRCGMEYSPAARFCHICGSSRERPPRASLHAIASETSPRNSRIRSAFSTLGLPSLVFFVLGVACIIMAAAMGAIYRTDTLMDWQAVQLWRIEWLLAASAALLVGILLKQSA